MPESTTLLAVLVIAMPVLIAAFVAYHCADLSGFPVATTPPAPIADPPIDLLSLEAQAQALADELIRLAAAQRRMHQDLDALKARIAARALIESA